MVKKNYYSQQAKTLRKFAGATLDRTLAARLHSMAADFESKAEIDDECSLGPPPAVTAGADGDEGHG